jgi:hypothetical protein
MVRRSSFNTASRSTDATEGSATTVTLVRAWAAPDAP